MFKIGEFSKLVRVSPRMLRHYEQNGVLRPAEVDRFTGYRLYSAAQIPLLSRIIELRDAGFGVEEIKTILPKYDDHAAMREALHRKQAQVEKNLAAEQAKLAKIAALCGKLQEVNMVYNVEIKTLPTEKVLSLREIIPSPEQETEQWEKLAAFIAKKEINASAVGYSIYHDDDAKETDVDIEVAVNVESFGADWGNFKFKELPAIPQAAIVRFSGPYTGYYEAISKLAAWIEENGYVMSGGVRGLGIKSHANCDNESDFLTELQIPVEKV